MIAADKRVLETSLSSRTLAIQGALLKLYTHNIYAISLIAALIGEMVWDTNQIGWPAARKFTKNKDYDHEEYPFVQYFFYSINGIALIISFYVLGISAIYSMWGPIMATNGHDASAVRQAAALLKENQYQIFVLMNIVYILILVGTCFFLWALLESINAAVCSAIMLGGAVVIVYYGFATVRTFNPEITLEKIFFPQYEIEEEHKDIIAQQRSIENEVKKIKHRGSIYMVNAHHEGLLFTKYYASLENGVLCIYKNEHEYLEYEAPIVEPFDMSEYRVVVDPDEIKETKENPSQRVTHFRKRLSGHLNLSVLQVLFLSDGCNLVEASQKYAFNLVPKANHEFIKVKVGEFMAENLEAYKMWTNVLNGACTAEEKTIQHVSNFLQGDSMTVELAAKAANFYNQTSREDIRASNFLKSDPIFEDGSLVLASFEKIDCETDREPSLVWRGPFTVLTKSVSGLYKVQDCDGMMHEFSINRLKYFEL